MTSNLATMSAFQHAFAAAAAAMAHAAGDQNHQHQQPNGAGPGGGTAAVQTASLGDRDVMTFLPPSAVAASAGGAQHERGEAAASEADSDELRFSADLEDLFGNHNIGIGGGGTMSENGGNSPPGSANPSFHGAGNPPGGAASASAGHAAQQLAQTQQPHFLYAGTATGGGASHGHGHPTALAGQGPGPPPAGSSINAHSASAAASSSAANPPQVSDGSVSTLTASSLSTAAAAHAHGAATGGGGSAPAPPHAAIQRHGAPASLRRSGGAKRARGGGVGANFQGKAGGGAAGGGGGGGGRPGKKARGGGGRQASARAASSVPPRPRPRQQQQQQQPQPFQPIPTVLTPAGVPANALHHHHAQVGAGAGASAAVPVAAFPNPAATALPILPPWMFGAVAAAAPPPAAMVAPPVPPPPPAMPVAVMAPPPAPPSAVAPSLASTAQILMPQAAQAPLPAATQQANPYAPTPPVSNPAKTNFGRRKPPPPAQQAQAAQVAPVFPNASLPLAAPLLAHGGASASAPAPAAAAPAPQTALSAPPPRTMAARRTPSIAQHDRRRNSSTLVVSEDETDRRRRRQERNQREQQRSHMITEQIGQLRDVLAAANVASKPDKYSTLVGVADYIKNLQRRSAMLDQEHRRLLDTISRTNEVVNGHHNHGQGAGQAPPAAGTPTNSSAVNRSSARGGGKGKGKGGRAKNAGGGMTVDSIFDDDDLLVFVRGLDYKSIFSRCGIALGIATVDGRFVDCNDEFVELSGHGREELVGPVDPATGQPLGMGGPRMSLFNLLTREDMEDVFGAMSRMLKEAPGDHAQHGGEQAAAAGLDGDGDGDEDMEDEDEGKGAAAGGGRVIVQKFHLNKGDHWSGVVRRTKKRDLPLRLNISLVRSSDGRPKFFNCALNPEDQDGGSTSSSLAANS